MVAVIYRLTHSPSQLASSEGWHSVCVHQMNWVISCNGNGHDDSTINIRLHVIITPHRPYYVHRCGLLLPIEQSGLPVTLVSPAKMAAPIEMPFGLRTRMCPRNHVLDGGAAVLRDIAMATNFWDAICCNWLCGL